MEQFGTDCCICILCLWGSTENYEQTFCLNITIIFTTFNSALCFSDIAETICVVPTKTIYELK